MRQQRGLAFYLLILALVILVSVLARRSFLDRDTMSWGQFQSADVYKRQMRIGLACPSCISCGGE